MYRRGGPFSRIVKRFPISLHPPQFSWEWRGFVRQKLKFFVNTIFIEGSCRSTNKYLDTHPFEIKRLHKSSCTYHKPTLPGRNDRRLVSRPLVFSAGRRSSDPTAPGAPIARTPAGPEVGKGPQGAAPLRLVDGKKGAGSSTTTVGPEHGPAATRARGRGASTELVPRAGGEAPGAGRADPLATLAPRSVSSQ